MVTLNGSDSLVTDTILPGTPVRLRLINADSYPATFHLQGTPFQVASIDGNDVNEPNLIANQSLKIAAGGRYDITFSMPNQPVYLTSPKDAGKKGLLLSPNGSTDIPGILEVIPEFDPSRYGSPLPLPFDLSSRYDREYQMIFDVAVGFYDGRLDGLWTINGNAMLVLSRNGKPVTGSPWWTDTLNVTPGETYEVAFRADNPGLWMDHCHNLDHAALGMTMHLL